MDDIVKETRKYAELALSSDNKNYYTLVADTIDRLRAEVARLQGQLDARIEQLHESESYGFRLTQQLAAANGKITALREYAETVTKALECFYQALNILNDGPDKSDVDTAANKISEGLDIYVEAILLPKPWEK